MFDFCTDLLLSQCTCSIDTVYHLLEVLKECLNRLSPSVGNSLLWITEVSMHTNDLLSIASDMHAHKAEARLLVVINSCTKYFCLFCQKNGQQ